MAPQRQMLVALYTFHLPTLHLTPSTFPPYTLHLTPYTLHLTPSHFTPYTNPGSSSLNIIPYTPAP